jgi:hypothetical protein
MHDHEARILRPHLDDQGLPHFGMPSFVKAGRKAFLMRRLKAAGVGTVFAATACVTPASWRASWSDRAKVPPGLRRDLFKHLVNAMKARQIRSDGRFGSSMRQSSSRRPLTHDFPGSNL